MQELIPLHSQTIDGNAVETVSARELHEFLESKQDFSTWIKNRISEYEFAENQDYVKLAENKASQKNGAEKSMTYDNWQGRIEYYITLDMAKELAMVERNEKGKQSRKYFIECEKQLNAQQSQSPTTYLEALEALLASEKAKLTQEPPLQVLPFLAIANRINK